MLVPLAGLLLIGIGVPFYLRMVPPNHWSGVRVPKTKSNPEIWYAANHVLGRNFIIAGIVILIVSVCVRVLAQNNPSLPANKINNMLLLVSFGAAILFTLVSLIRM